MLFSLSPTLPAWQLDVAQWLTAYLSVCTANHGQPPPDSFKADPSSDSV